MDDKLAEALNRSILNSIAEFSGMLILLAKDIREWGSQYQEVADTVNQAASYLSKASVQLEQEFNRDKG